MDSFVDKGKSLSDKESHSQAELQLISLENALEVAGIGSMRISIESSQISITSVNNTLANTLGYSKQEFLEFEYQDFQRIIHPEDADKFALLNSVVRGETEKLVTEARFISKQGRTVYMNINASSDMVIGGDVKKLSAMILFRDIAKEKMEEFERRIYEFTDKTLLGVMTTNWNGEILSMNKAGLEMMGYESFKELKEIDTGKLYTDPDIRKTFRDIIQNEGVVKNFIADLRRKDGNVITVRITANAQVDQQGEVIGYNAIVDDITEELEAIRLRKEISINEAKREVLNMITGQTLHDIKHPITAGLVQISGLKQKVENGLLSDFTQIADSLEKIYETLRQEIDLFERLERVSLDRDTVLFNFEEIPNHEFLQLIEKIIDRSSEEARAKGLSVKFTPQEKIPSGKIRADKVQISEVVMNLLSNAVKYSSDGNIDFHLKFDRGSLVIVCSDNGIGIPEEHLSNIFDSGFRAKNAIAIDGEGIGLASVKSIVEGHGGKIDVVSEIGKGSTFTIIIPSGSGKESTTLSQ